MTLIFMRLVMLRKCTDWHTGKPKRVQLAWHAHRQAYIVASHLSENPVKINGFLGTYNY